MNNQKLNPTINLVDVVFPTLTLTLGFTFETLAAASAEGFNIMDGLDIPQLLKDQKFSKLLYLAAKANMPDLTQEQVDDLPFSLSAIVILSKAIGLAWSGGIDQDAKADTDPNEQPPSD